MRMCCTTRTRTKSRPGRAGGDALAVTLTTALIYSRVSSDEQANRGLSLDAQLAECRRYALRQGWVLGGEYTDVLAGWRDDRPQYSALLAEVRTLRSQGQPLAVVCAALDRFGRRLMERVRSREELKALGVPIHSVREGGEVSDLVANILASVAQEETRRQGERIRATWAHVRSSGWFPHANVPAWGYRWRDATPDERRDGAPKRVLDRDEMAAPYAVEMFERCARGESIRAIARWVHTLPPPVWSGRKLGYASVQRLLQSATYISRPATEREPLDAPPQRWPALVDDLTWLRAQQHIADHQHRRHQASGRYLLTGYLRCPQCGGRLTGAALKQRWPYYRCNGEIANPGQPCRWGMPGRAVDGPVIEAVGELLAALDSPRLTAQWRRWERTAALESETKVRSLQLAQVQRDLAREQQRLTDAALLLLDGTLDRAGYDRVVMRGQEVVPALEAEVRRLDVEPRARVPPSVAEIQQLRGAWRLEDIPIRRRILGLLVAGVEVERVGFGQYEVTITWTALGETLRQFAELVR